VIPTKLKRKTHPCCEAFEGSNPRNGKHYQVSLAVASKRDEECSRKNESMRPYYRFKSSTVVKTKEANKAERVNHTASTLMNAAEYSV
jgi:hypothetical protein